MVKVELRPRRERAEVRDPLTGKLMLDKAGNPVTVELLPTERAIWAGPSDPAKEDEDSLRHVGYVDVGKGNPINILPPITIGVQMLEWPEWWQRAVCDEVCKQLDGRTNSRPCGLIRGYVTPDEEEILAEMIEEEQRGMMNVEDT